MNSIETENLRSFAETLTEISLLIGMRYDDIRNVINDSTEVNSLCIQWAEIFEAKNKGREWDGEWMMEVNDFINDKINFILNPANKDVYFNA